MPSDLRKRLCFGEGWRPRWRRLRKATVRVQVYAALAPAAGRVRVGCCIVDEAFTRTEPASVPISAIDRSA